MAAITFHSSWKSVTIDMLINIIVGFGFAFLIYDKPEVVDVMNIAMVSTLILNIYGSMPRYNVFKWMNLLEEYSSQKCKEAFFGNIALLVLAGILFGFLVIFIPTIWFSLAFFAAMLIFWVIITALTIIQNW